MNPSATPPKYRRLHLLHWRHQRPPRHVAPGKSAPVFAYARTLLEINERRRKWSSRTQSRLSGLVHQSEGPWETAPGGSDAAPTRWNCSNVSSIRPGRNSTGATRKPTCCARTCEVRPSRHWRPSRRRGSARWIGSRHAGSLQKFWSRKSSNGRTPAQRRRIWNFITIDPARSLAWAMSQPPPPWDLSVKAVEAGDHGTAGGHPACPRPLAPLSCGCSGNTRRRTRLIWKSSASRSQSAESA